MNMYDKILIAKGITSTEKYILSIILKDVEVFGHCKQTNKEIANQIGQSDSGVYKAITSLAKKGLINRMVSKELGNTRKIFLTNLFYDLMENTIKNDNQKRVVRNILENKEEIILHERKELVFVEKLEKELVSLGLIGVRQYVVLDYRIDYYLPFLNVAIEYDENDHKHYTYEDHELRQTYIEMELGCEFIRLSDDDSDDTNIRKVLEFIKKYHYGRWVRHHDEQ